jgi:hypothetical protein
VYISLDVCTTDTHYHLFYLLINVKFDFFVDNVKMERNKKVKNSSLFYFVHLFSQNQIATDARSMVHDSDLKIHIYPQ